MIKWLIENSKWVLNNTGGSSGTEVIQAPPAPSAGETAADIAKARLQYDPQMAQQQMELQQQYMPQQTELYNALLQQYGPGAAQMQTDIQVQQMPQLQALQAALFPQQSQMIEAGAGQALGAFSPYLQQLQQQGQQSALQGLQQPQSALLQQLGQQAGQGYQPTSLQQQLAQQAQAQLTPTGLSPEQSSAIEAIRGREMGRVQKGARERANLGGTLFGGGAQVAEGLATQQLGQRFAAEDVDRLMQQQALAQQFGLGVAGQQQQGLGQAQQFGLQTAGQQSQAGQQALMNAFATQQAAQQQAQPFMNILYPQAAAGQQAQQLPFQFQSAVPDPNAQLNAVAQLLGTQAVVPGQQSGLWGLGGAIAGGAGVAI